MSHPYPDLSAYARDIVLGDGRVHVFTDGASKLKDGRFLGGWGCYLTWKGREKDLSGSEDGATVNRMELMAIYKALEVLSLKQTAHSVLIYSDSAYSVNTLSVWARNWAKNGWVTASGEPVKNRELIEEIQKLLQPRVSIRWLKGHNDQPGNERADRLAVAARLELERTLFGPIVDKKRKKPCNTSTSSSSIAAQSVVTNATYSTSGPTVVKTVSRSSASNRQRRN